MAKLFVLCLPFVLFLKINTKNYYEETQGYTITIDTNITPDPRKASVTGTIELYASNEETVEYYYEGQLVSERTENLSALYDTMIKCKIVLKVGVSKGASTYFLVCE
mgnify:CR=1 FL=1